MDMCSDLLIHTFHLSMQACLEVMEIIYLLGHYIGLYKVHVQFGSLLLEIANKLVVNTGIYFHLRHPTLSTGFENISVDSACTSN